MSRRLRSRVLTSTNAKPSENREAMTPFLTDERGEGRNPTLVEFESSRCIS